MIIMGKDKKQGGMVSLIMKKMKNGNNDFESLKNQNEEHVEEAPMKDGAEQDDSSAINKAASDVMSSIESKDIEKLKSSLKLMIKMCIDS